MVLIIYTLSIYKFRLFAIFVQNLIDMFSQRKAPFSTLSSEVRTAPSDNWKSQNTKYEIIEPYETVVKNLEIIFFTTNILKIHSEITDD